MLQRCLNETLLTNSTVRTLSCLCAKSSAELCTLAQSFTYCCLTRSYTKVWIPLQWAMSSIRLGRPATLKHDFARDIRLNLRASYYFIGNNASSLQCQSSFFFFCLYLFFWAFNTDFLIFFPLMDVRGRFDLESTYAWRMIFSAQLAVSDDWGVKIGTASY